MGTPVTCTTSAMGWMSTTIVRAAQFGWMRSLLSAISRHSVSTACRWRGPDPGRPTSAVSIPRRSIRWRISTFTVVSGSITDGLCNPSRRVSSSSMGRTDGSLSWPFCMAQSKMSCCSGGLLTAASLLYDEPVANACWPARTGVPAPTASWRPARPPPAAGCGRGGTGCSPHPLHRPGCAETRAPPPSGHPYARG